MLSDDYFAVPGDAIQDITAVLTLLGGKVVHGDAEFKDLAPSLPPPMPDWSPVGFHGGYQPRDDRAAPAHRRRACALHGHDPARAWAADLPVADEKAFWGALGCSCWAF